MSDLLFTTKLDEALPYVTKVDGRTILVDPAGAAFMESVKEHNRGVAMHNCRLIFDKNHDRVLHFANRMQVRGDDPKDVAIVLIHVDDPHGGPIADVLMPGHDWQQFRDAGQLPLARGLASRPWIEHGIELFDPATAKTLREWDGVAVIVVSFGIAVVFSP